MQLQFKWHEDDTRPREACSRKIGWISKDSPTPCYRFGNICCKFFCGVSAKFHSPQSTTCKVQSLCPCWQNKNMPFFASNNSQSEQFSFELFQRRQTWTNVAGKGQGRKTEWTVECWVHLRIVCRVEKRRQQCGISLLASSLLPLMRRSRKKASQFVFCRICNPSSLWESTVSSSKTCIVKQHAANLEFENHYLVQYKQRVLFSSWIAAACVW